MIVEALTFTLQESVKHCLYFAGMHLAVPVDTGRANRPL